jgi:hypothetical protein
MSLARSVPRAAKTGTPNLNHFAERHDGADLLAICDSAKDGSTGGNNAMAVSRQVCPFHADEDILGVATGSQDRSLSFTCTIRTGHPQPGPHTWLYVPQLEGLPGVDGYAAELALASELPAAIADYRGTWIEYGVAERAYAMRRPDDFAAIVARYGHKAIAPKQYTASAFLAGVLGILSRQGTLLYHLGPATGRWAYNEKISWWAFAPSPDWTSARLSWAEEGDSISYIPGAKGP